MNTLRGLNVYWVAEKTNDLSSLQLQLFGIQKAHICYSYFYSWETLIGVYLSR